MMESEQEKIDRLMKAKSGLQQYYNNLTDADKSKGFGCVQEFNNHYNRLSAICDFQLYSLLIKNKVGQ